MAVMQAFAALADPTRARIMDELASGDRTAGELVGLFDLTQPAVSHHLRVLREADLVVARWLDRYRRFWAGKLDDLERHMDEEAP
jgi:DNA-binding transcriptional ArsR family regulator